MHQHNYAPGNTQNIYVGPSETRWAGSAFAVPPLTGREVIRPALLTEAITAVLGTGINGPVAMTTRVTGASGGGGFGKSTLARLVAHDRDVRGHFSDGIVWVTMGQDVQGPDIADRVNNLTELFTGVKPALTDPLAAGARLVGVLRGRRILVIVDDAWARSQLEPFLVPSADGNPGPVVLVTTRKPSVLPHAASPIYVEAMARDEAVALLTGGLPGVPSPIVGRLLELTSSWPVLLGLVNGAARTDVADGLVPGEALAGLAEQLAADGPDVLELDDDASRGRAVTATMRASLSRLSLDEQDRYKELAVFAPAADIPLELLERYWRWSPAQVSQFCRLLADLSLVARHRMNGAAPGVRLHDIIRSWLRHDVADRLPDLHAQLLDAHRDLVPVIGRRSQWQALPVPPAGPATRYLWESLSVHLHGANLDDELSAVLTEPRWLGGKLAVTGPAGLEVDLSTADDPVCRALSQVVRQNSHLLAPLEPEGSLTATLTSRFPGDPQLATVRTALTATMPGPYLQPAGHQPDLPPQHLHRRLAGHVRGVEALAVAPDGSWIASSAGDGTVRIWDPETGGERGVFTGHGGPREGVSNPVGALAVAPDGSWIASGGWNGTIRIWTPETLAELYELSGHSGRIEVLAVAPDGSWIASGVHDHHDHTVRIWDLSTGAQRHVLTRATCYGSALAVAPDGSWLAAAEHEGTVRIWDPETGTERRVLTGHNGEARALAVAPDGSWLAAAEQEGTVRIWDPETGTERRVLTGHNGEARALAVAPDGSWLASTGDDGMVRIWDLATGTERHVLTRRTGSGKDLAVRAMAVAPDGSWLASGDYKGMVRIWVWDPESRAERYVFSRHSGPVQMSAARTLAVAPDGSWLAAAGDGAVRIWNPATGTEHHALTGHADAPAPASAVWALAIAPDCSWMASAGADPRVRICDPVTGTELHALTGHHYNVRALTVAPDGSWLASGAADDTVRIWDPRTGAKRHVLTGHSGMVGVLAVAPDGSWLASGAADDTVRIWDPRTGAKRHVLTGHSGMVGALAVAPDSSWLAFAGDDSTIWIWNLKTGKRHVLYGHSRQIRALSVAPDGSWLASSGDDVLDLGPRHRDHRGQAARAHRPQRLGDGAGGCAGWFLACLRRGRRHGPGLGPRDRGRAVCAHRPQRYGPSLGGCAGWFLACLRRGRRHGPDLGPRHRSASDGSPG